MCGGGLPHLKLHHKDIPGTTHDAYHTRYVDKNIALTEMVTTTSNSYTLHMYVRRTMYIRHIHIDMTAGIHIWNINAVG